MTTDVVRTHIVTREELREMFGCQSGDTINAEWVSAEVPYLKVKVTESKKDSKLADLKK